MQRYGCVAIARELQSLAGMGEWKAMNLRFHDPQQEVQVLQPLLEDVFSVTKDRVDAEDIQGV